jgi:hypothetical protein
MIFPLLSGMILRDGYQRSRGEWIENAIRKFKCRVYITIENIAKGHITVMKFFVESSYLWIVILDYIEKVQRNNKDANFRTPT